MEPGQAQGLTRRTFVAGAGAGVLGVAGLAQALEMIRAASEALAAPPPEALAPTDPAVKATMTAFCDTIVPGPAGGADSEPGAVESGAHIEIYDPFYGASGSYPVMHEDLQAATARTVGGGRAFDLELPYEDRARVVEDRLRSLGSGGDNPLYLLYQGVALIVYVAHYGTARSSLGPESIGFPPHATAYWPRHGHDTRFRGMTRHGNPS